MPKRLAIFLIISGLSFGFQCCASDNSSNGILLKGSGPEVYVLEHGARRWIPTPVIFNNLYFDWRKIKYVFDYVLNSYPVGANLTNDFPDGVLIKSEKSPKVYLYDAGKIRGVPDETVFYSNNFSWENIIVVSDKTVRAKKIGADVKSGEFLLLPTAFITAKPPEEINFTDITFSYSGVNPSGPVSELVWETFLDGYDKGWQGATSKYSRTIVLPAVNKTYTFYVRSRNKQGKISSRSASFAFKVIGFSSLSEKIKISNVKGKGSPELGEYVSIVNSSKENINISKLVLKNKAGETIKIPKGAKKFYPSQGETEDIILEEGNSATIFTGFSPVGRSFRLNKCTGYLNPNKFFMNLPEECPKVLDQDIADLAKDCRDYIKTIKICGIADLDNIKIRNDNSCKDYINNNLNYRGCFDKHQYDPDFLKKSWYIFLEKPDEVWHNQHDDIRLLDESNNLIDSYSY